MICYCGYDCGKCPVYLGKTDEAKAYYREKLGMEVQADRLICKGGRSEEICYFCEDCPFRRCCREKGLRACADCPAPCEMYLEYYRKYVGAAAQ